MSTAGTGTGITLPGLRLALLRRNATPSEVASRAGLCVETVYRAMRGYPVTARTASKIAATLATLPLTGAEEILEELRAQS